MSEILYGKNNVLAYLKSGNRPLKAYSLKQGNLNEIEGLLKKMNVSVQRVDKKQLDQKANGNHQGILLEIDGYKTTPLESIIQNGAHKLLVMLDQVEDPHNLGAILRTCDAVGVDGVIIGKHRSVGLNATVAKVSTGAIHTVPVASVTNLSQTLQSLKEQGYWVVACENGVDAVSYTQFPVDMPLVIVMGSEGKGISRIVKENADILVTIPMVGTVNSLNVSVASAVILYEVMRRRGD